MLLSGDLLRWNAERILIMKHITGLAHIALFTNDLETSIKFYECLGGKGTDVTAQGGLFPHIAIEVNDIDAAIADLKAAGITNFRGGVDKAADLPIFGGIRNAFFIGPNGEQLELLQHL